MEITISDSSESSDNFDSTDSVSDSESFINLIKERVEIIKKKMEEEESRKNVGRKRRKKRGRKRRRPDSYPNYLQCIPQCYQSQTHQLAQPSKPNSLEVMDNLGQSLPMNVIQPAIPTVTEEWYYTDLAYQNWVKAMNTKKTKSRTKPKTKSRAKKKRSSIFLWEFLLNLLQDKDYCPQYIKWTDRENGIFKLIDSKVVSMLWGLEKRNPKMTFNKMTRTLRRYYRNGIITKVDGEPFVFKYVNVPKDIVEIDCSSEPPTVLSTEQFSTSND